MTVALDTSGAEAKLRAFLEQARAASQQIRSMFGLGSGIGGSLGGGSGPGVPGPAPAIPGGNVGGGFGQGLSGINQAVTSALNNIQQMMTSAVQSIAQGAQSRVAAAVQGGGIGGGQGLGGGGGGGGGIPNQFRSRFGLRFFGGAFFAYRGVEEMVRRFQEDRDVAEAMQYDTPQEAFDLISKQTEANRHGVGTGIRTGFVKGLRKLGITNLFGRELMTDDEQDALQRQTRASEAIADRGTKFGFETRLLGQERSLIGADPFTRGMGEAYIRFQKRQQEGDLANQWAGRMETIFGMDMGSGVLRHAAAQYVGAASDTLASETAYLRRQRGYHAMGIEYEAAALGYAAHLDPQAGIIAARGRALTADAESQGQAQAIRDAIHRRGEAEVAIEERREKQRLAILGGRSETLAFELQRRPLEAQIAEINARESAATSGMTDPGELARQRGIFEQERRLHRMEHSDTERLMNISLGGRQQQIQALLGRSPIGAEAIGIATRGAEQITELGQHGFRDQASQALKNTMDELTYFRRNYLESARGVQADFTLMDYTNRRDQENPSDVLKRIEDLLTNLPNVLKDAIDQ